MPENRSPELDLSVVLPVYNEQENIELMHQEIAAVLDGLDLAAEVIYVDDGSTDGTLDCLKSLVASDARVVVAEFRRNFGQTAAMAAGFDLARGEIIVTMDADRQNDPADIPKLLSKIEEGYDLVSGWRHERKDGYWLRLLPSKIVASSSEAEEDVGSTDLDLLGCLCCCGFSCTSSGADSDWCSLRRSFCKL